MIQISYSARLACRLLHYASLWGSGIVLGFLVLRDWLQAVALTQQGDMHQAVQGLKTRCVDRIYSEGDERLSAVVRSYMLLRLEPDRLFQIENNRLVCCHLFPFIATSTRRILPSPQELNVFSTEFFFCHSHFEKCLNSHIKSCFFQSGMSTRCLDSSDYLIMWSSCWYLSWEEKKTTKVCMSFRIVSICWFPDFQPESLVWWNHWSSAAFVINLFI